MNKPTPSMSEALECCREEDLARLNELPELRELAEALQEDPELAQRFRELQQCDAKLASALTDMPAPSGLAERISAAVDDATPNNASDSDADGPVERVSDEASGPRGWRSRSNWIAITAVAAVLLVALIPLFQPAPARSSDQLVTRTPLWKQATEEAAWRSTAPPKDRPTSELLTYFPDEVTVVSTADDRRTAAYRFNRPLGRGRGEVYLFVLKTPATGLPSAPPATPDFDSGGIQVGVWTEKNLVYALVVLGNDEAYRRLVRRRAQAA